MAMSHVIVGAGSAGATLAARLAEDPRNNVLLLEAGPDYPSVETTPQDLRDSRNLAEMTHDWGYEAVPVPGRTIPYRRGRVTGGTSAINAAAAQWGRPEDFAAWTAQGNTEWGWEQASAFFRRLESDPHGVGEHHGAAGPIPISRYEDAELIPIQRAFKRACVGEGIRLVRDHNDLRSGGVGPWPMNRVGSTRVSTATAYLDEGRGRANLAIRPLCRVDRLILENRRVVGLELTGDVKERLDVEGSVVLSAGAIGSPAILLRSGIGPRGDLEALGISPVLDLPGVGKRLYDHAAVPIRMIPKAGECLPGRDPRFQTMAKFTAPGSDEPDDMQLVMVSHQDLSPFPALVAEYGVSTVAMLLVALMVPRGHGRLSLTTADPSALPRVELGFADHPEDLERLRAGLRLAWRVAHAMSEGVETIAGLDEATIDVDEALDEYVRRNVVTYCHALGTARMGPGEDVDAVVDQRFKVRGAENLWLVDASVIPSPPRVVPNLTVIMLAERAAEWMRDTGDASFQGQ